jgi:hypothetical protein
MLGPKKEFFMKTIISFMYSFTLYFNLLKPGFMMVEVKTKSHDDEVCFFFHQNLIVLI